MKNLLILFILALGVSITSCSNNTKVRAIDVLTGVPAPIKCDTAYYKSGDTVWVNTHYMEVSKKTHLYVNTIDYRKFVLKY